MEIKGAEGMATPSGIEDEIDSLGQGKNISRLPWTFVIQWFCKHATHAKLVFATHCAVCKNRLYIWLERTVRRTLREALLQ